MPSKGYKTVILHSNGSVYEQTSNELILNKIADATGLPPHGDLIDRSDVLAVVDEAYEYGDVIERRDFDENNIPTIVPAERSGEDG